MMTNVGKGRKEEAAQKECGLMWPRPPPNVVWAIRSQCVLNASWVCSHVNTRSELGLCLAVWICSSLHTFTFFSALYLRWKTSRRTGMQEGKLWALERVLYMIWRFPAGTLFPCKHVGVSSSGDSDDWNPPGFHQNTQTKARQFVCKCWPASCVCVCVCVCLAEVLTCKRVLMMEEEDVIFQGTRVEEGLCICVYLCMCVLSVHLGVCEIEVIMLSHYTHNN